MIGLVSKIRERRSSRRHRLPSLMVRIENHRYRTADWSAGGFRLRGTIEPFARSDRVRGQIKTPSGTLGWFIAEAAWRSEDAVGFRFIEIDSNVFLDLHM
ncbi:hypothetical protein CKO28_15750 [Rhodovibrio sodomensis]|uniref:PilZ domain-containing protein n=1 Tax=Rhodovibrio sodomensis TaxID=1088 RepID=A0ABS1DGU5_9PROT|nr:hypothetical protein [Rhodovibrio sodomensis]